MKYLQKLQAKTRTLAVAFAALVVMSLSAVGVNAEETTSLQLDFDPAEMFAWTQMILDIMMPILYITLGVSLAFIVIRALKSAFS